MTNEQMDRIKQATQELESALLDVRGARWEVSFGVVQRRLPGGVDVYEHRNGLHVVMKDMVIV